MDIQKILGIEKDIKDLNIQGATNVAIATLEGMKIYIYESEQSDPDLFYKELMEVGQRLANARENEPLARNGVGYIKYMYKQKNIDLHDIKSMKQALDGFCEQFLTMIADSKRSIIEQCVPRLKFFENVLTHCHSSTALAVIKGIGEGNDSFDVVCTESRPRYQGRKTARSLLNEGISTTMIVDSAVESFIIGRGSVPIDAVFIGSDQITMGGYCINKIGSWGIAMSAYHASKPVYVVSPLLKVDPSIGVNDLVIEVREDRELWPDAPKDLMIYNPAFEVVDRDLVTGFLTEFGIVKPREIADIIRAKYAWLFET